VADVVVVTMILEPLSLPFDVLVPLAASAKSVQSPLRNAEPGASLIYEKKLQEAVCLQAFPQLWMLVKPKPPPSTCEPTRLVLHEMVKPSITNDPGWPFVHWDCETAVVVLCAVEVAGRSTQEYMPLSPPCWHNLLSQQSYTPGKQSSERAAHAAADVVLVASDVVVTGLLVAGRSTHEYMPLSPPCWHNLLSQQSYTPGKQSPKRAAHAAAVVVLAAAEVATGRLVVVAAEVATLALLVVVTAIALLVVVIALALLVVVASLALCVVVTTLALVVVVTALALVVVVTAPALLVVVAELALLVVVVMALVFVVLVVVPTLALAVVVTGVLWANG
jgi:hypothetical protein